MAADPSMPYLQLWLREDGSRIRGTELEPELAAILSLEEESFPARRALINMTCWLQSAVLVGNQAPIVRAMYERIYNPQPGDLVVEQTTMQWTRKGEVARWGSAADNPENLHWVQAVGVLIEQRTEWADTDEEWQRQVAEEEVYEDERMAEKAFYVQYGPSPEDVCRWHNAGMLTIPWEQNDYKLEVKDSYR